MELIEKHDLAKVRYLNSLSFKEFEGFCSCKKKEDKKIQYDILKNYCKAIILSKGEIKRIYAHSVNSPLEIGGRLFCGNSIQGLKSKIRGFLMKHTTDIDMKNAHPVILSYICKKHDIRCIHLDYYIQNRDVILSEFSDRDVGKAIFLKSVNDDQHNQRIGNKFFKNFDNEMKEIQKELIKIEEYAPIISTIVSKNFNGSSINKILCKYENEILQVVINLSIRENIEICALMFDGLMVYGNFYENTEFLQRITQEVEEKFNGLNMEWAYKSHDDTIEMPEMTECVYSSIDEVMKAKLDSIRNEIDICLSTVVATDYDLAIAFNALFKGKVKYHFESKLWFVFDHHWNSDATGSIVSQMISSDFWNVIDCQFNIYSNELLQTEDEKRKEYLSELIKKTVNILIKLKKTSEKKNIITELRHIVNDELIMDKMNKEKYILPLKENKIIDLRTNEIRDITINNYFDYECPVSFLQLTEEQEKDIQNYFLDLFCGKHDIMHCFIDIIKSILTGRTLRFIYFWTGSGRNGKSLILKILAKIFGKAIDSVSKDVILQKKGNTHLTTEFEKLDKCRIGYATELTETDNLNVATIKAISGGDAINVRGICTTDKTMNSTTNLCVITNELPKFKKEDTAIVDRIIVIPFLNKFEGNADFEDVMMEKTDLIFSFIMKYGVIRSSFEQTEEMKVAKENYEEANDIDFLRDYLMNQTKKLEGSRIKRDDFRASYNEWKAKQKFYEPTQSSAAFTRRLTKLGVKHSESHGKTVYLDIAFSFGEEE